MTGESSTLRDELVARAHADPDRIAFDDGRWRITYGDLAKTAAGQAHRLAEYGVQAGDRVAMAMSAGIPFAQAFWALQLLGAVPCALNPTVPAQTLERRAAHVRPRLVLRDGVLEDAAPSRTMPPPPAITTEDIAVLQTTSGTSGEPRAAMVRHRNVLAYLKTHGHEFVSPDDVLVAWVPPWHDLGLIRFVVGAVSYGAPCHIVPPAVRTIPQWLETIGRVRGTVTGAPDFAYRIASRMVDPATVDVSSLRFATNGGEPVRRSTIEEFEQRFSHTGAVLPGYGLAEATLGVTTHAPGEPLVVDERGNVSNGTCHSNTEIRIGESDGATGELLIRGDTLFAGYFDAPEETSETLRDGWLHSGDIGYLDDQGRLFVLGRSRALIKRGGGAVAPRELEEAAQEVEGVRVAAAVGVPDPAGVTEMAVVAVEDRRANSREGDAVAAAVSRAVAASSGFAPGQVLVLPPRTIPRTENGKIRHARLRELLLDGLIGAPPSGAARA